MYEPKNGGVFVVDKIIKKFREVVTKIGSRKRC
jgi:hypothetical protein